MKSYMLSSGRAQPGTAQPQQKINIIVNAKMKGIFHTYQFREVLCFISQQLLKTPKCTVVGGLSVFLSKINLMKTR